MDQDFRVIILQQKESARYHRWPPSEYFRQLVGMTELHEASVEATDWRPTLHLRIPFDVSSVSIQSNLASGKKDADFKLLSNRQCKGCS